MRQAVAVRGNYRIRGIGCEPNTGQAHEVACKPKPRLWLTDEHARERARTACALEARIRDPNKPRRAFGVIGRQSEGSEVGSPTVNACWHCRKRARDHVERPRAECAVSVVNDDGSRMLGGALIGS